MECKQRGDFDLRIYKRHKKIKILSALNMTPYYYYLTYCKKIPEEPGTAKTFIYIFSNRIMYNVVAAWPNG